MAINAFPTDTQEELSFVENLCQRLGVPASLSEVFSKGGAGGVDLAQKVTAAAEQGGEAFRLLYPDELPLVEKIRTISREIYGAQDVSILPAAMRELQSIESLGGGSLPVCMAKTQYSLSDDPTLLGRPRDFTITVRSVRLAAGAGFVVCETGAIMTMPGLPKRPAAEAIDVDDNGVITGLF